MEWQKMNKIVLVGFMGTGKSTVCKQLSDRLGWSCVDADEVIERTENRTISDIFAVDGEDSFRAIETRVLTELLQDHSSAVIATGGGAVLKQENTELMLNGAFVVALKAEPAQIIARVQSDTSRPLLQGNVADRVNQLLVQRKHAYDFAHLIIDTTDLSVEEVVSAIMNHQIE